MTKPFVPRIRVFLVKPNGNSEFISLGLFKRKKREFLRHHRWLSKINQQWVRMRRRKAAARF